MSFAKTLREQAISQGFKLLSHPRVADLLANENVMGAISKGIELKSRIQGNVDCAVRSFAEKAGLATQDDFADLKKHFDDIKRRFETLKATQQRHNARKAADSESSSSAHDAASDVAKSKKKNDSGKSDMESLN